MEFSPLEELQTFARWVPEADVAYADRPEALKIAVDALKDAGGGVAEAGLTARAVRDLTALSRRHNLALGYAEAGEGQTLIYSVMVL